MARVSLINKLLLEIDSAVTNHKFTIESTIRYLGNGALELLFGRPACSSVILYVRSGSNNNQQSNSIYVSSYIIPPVIRGLFLALAERA